MHVIYADSGLASEIGHHANACRLITAALRGRGQHVTTAGWEHMLPTLAEDLQAQRHFRLNTYQAADTDPICGWLTGCLLGADIFAQDLGRLTPHDLLYVNSVMPPQLLGVHRFLENLPPAEQPHVVVELGTDPGLDLATVDGTPVFHPRDPRIDARATLYRFVGRQLQAAAAAAARLHLVTFDRGSSELYGQLLGVKVATLPVPHFAAQPVRARGRATPVIGVLGHQRGEKGYALMPAIAAELLQRRPDITLLVHNATPDSMTPTQAEMRRLAAAWPQLQLDERAAGPQLWQALLDRCDLILCPYAPAAFRAGYSAIVSEAIAHGIPLVVPAGTTLERVLGEFGNPGTRFASHDPGSIVAAVLQALDDLPALADRAAAAARRWGEIMGAANMVDAMLARIASADMLARLSARAPAAQPAAPARQAVAA